MPPTEEEVRRAVARIEEPDVGRTLGELGLVRAVVVEAGRVQVGIALISPASPWGEHLRTQVTEAARGLGAGDVYVDVTHLSDDEQRGLRAALQGAAPPAPAEALARTRVIAVASGKGGVGKSAVAANLAVALVRRGHRTGLIDADVYGFSIPRMLGLERRPVIVDELLIPPRAFGVAVVSVAFFATDEQTPVIWRGPMLHKALAQFVTGVFWDRPDYLLVDMPPGTGDVALTMAQLLPASEIVVVTTPQPAAQKVAQRAAYMARKVSVTVTGVVENMSWYDPGDGTRQHLFGSGGGALLAEQLDVPLLGRLPLDPAIREGCDTGHPVVAADPGGEAARHLEALADALEEARPARRVTLPVISVR